MYLQLEVRNCPYLLLEGSVFACLRHVPEEYELKKFEFYHDLAFETSDIDLFLYGLSTEESKEKVISIGFNWNFEVKEIYATLCNIPELKEEPIHIYIGNQTVTFSRRYPFKNIQVIIHCFQLTFRL